MTVQFSSNIALLFIYLSEIYADLTLVGKFPKYIGDYL